MFKTLTSGMESVQKVCIGVLEKHPCMDDGDADIRKVGNGGVNLLFASTSEGARSFQGASNTSSNIQSLFGLSPYGCYTLAVRSWGRGHLVHLSFVFYLSPLGQTHFFPLHLVSLFPACTSPLLRHPLFPLLQPIFLPFYHHLAFTFFTFFALCWSISTARSLLYSILSLSVSDIALVALD